MRFTKARRYRNRRSMRNSRRNRCRRNTSSRSKRMRGGTVLASEYFGKDSGRYSPEEFSNPGKFAYGNYTPQSFGEDFDGKNQGPNLGVYPYSTNHQTGGYRKRRNNRKSKKNRRSRRSRRSNTRRK